MRSLRLTLKSASPRALSLYGLLYLALSFSLLSLILFSLLIFSSLYHFLFNALISWISEIGDFTMFSKDLGECSRFPPDFSASSDRLSYLMYLCLKLTPSAGTLAFGPNHRVQPLRL